MTILEKLLRALGFENLIHIPGASFGTLSNKQVALMIEGAIFGENDLFDSGAVHEFMIIPSRNSRLERIRLKIEEIAELNASSDNPDGLLTDGGMADLRRLALDLRKSESELR